MADSRFFHNAGPLSLDAIVALTGATLHAASPPLGTHNFRGVAPLDHAEAQDVTFLDNTKYVPRLSESKAGACFLRPKFKDKAPGGMLLLLTENPYYCYALTAQAFYPDADIAPVISPHAHISPDAHIGNHVRIDAGAVIEENVMIGDHSWIGTNSVIQRGVQIGAYCRIGALCSISHAVVGERVIMHRGVHIGQDGFGFAPTPKGAVKVPQLGRVIIGNHVEIGSGTCIDRGAGPDTVIGDGSKIDNLVQIGHNVHIGTSVMMAAGCGIAGSSWIGDGVMLGGQVGIAGHVRIGAGAKIAAQAGIMTDIPNGATYGGSPAVPIKDWHRQTVALSQLITKRKEPSDE